MKSQRTTLFVLLTVCSLLLLEYFRRDLYSTNRKEKKTEEKTENPIDTSKKVKTVADSLSGLYANISFKDKQLKNPRVNTAYKDKGDTLRNLYRAKKIDLSSLNIYIRAFKKEELIEVWAKDKNKTAYTLIKTFKFCKNSGTLGPKRRDGDKQIPEGFYHIDRFNPKSNFYLSLGLNYPNKSDKILGDTTGLGNDIFIHGDCQTVGCIPITDDKIKELYVIAVDAKAGGQGKIPFTIFPTKLTDANFNQLKSEYAESPKLIAFWKSLKTGFDAFEKCKKLPTVTITTKGEYVCKADCE